MQVGSYKSKACQNNFYLYQSCLLLGVNFMVFVLDDSCGCMLKSRKYSFYVPCSLSGFEIRVSLCN